MPEIECAQSRQRPDRIGNRSQDIVREDQRLQLRERADGIRNLPEVLLPEIEIGSSGSTFILFSFGVRQPQLPLLYVHAAPSQPPAAILAHRPRCYLSPRLIAIQQALHLEGGPEASLSIHTPALDLDLAGS